MKTPDLSSISFEILDLYGVYQVEVKQNKEFVVKCIQPSRVQNFRKGGVYY